MADNAKPGILRNLRVKRVSLVDIGANYDAGTGDGAHIMLYKAATQKDGPSLGSVHSDSPNWDQDDADDYEKADLSGQGRRALPDSSFAAVWTDAQGKKHRKLPIHDAGHLAAARGRLDQTQLPADVKAAARRKINAATNHKEKNVKKSMLKSFIGLFSETDAEKRTAAAAELEKAMADDCEDDETDDMKKKKAQAAKDAEGKDAVGKAVAEEVAKATTELQKKHAEEIAKIAKANTDLTAAIEVEKGIRLDGEMRTILKGFRATSFDIDKDVAKFRKMKESSPEEYNRVMEILKGADAMLASSALFNNFGTSAEGTGDAWAQIEAKADAMVEKLGDKLTREQAIEKVMLDPKNMHLVKAYRGVDKVQ